MLKIITSTIADGIMNNREEFFPNTSFPERNKIFINNINNFLNKNNIPNNQIIIPDQKSLVTKHQKKYNYADGKYIIIDDDLVNKKVRKNAIKKICCDFVVCSAKYKNILIAETVADCPVVIAYTNNVFCLGHCGAEYIDRKLPEQIIAYLLTIEKDPSNIKVYVGPSVKKENYIYDCYPKWATNKEVWQDAIIKDHNFYHIDMAKAIYNELIGQGILKENISFSPIDTVTNNSYYSNIKAKAGFKNKNGRFLVGAYFK